MESGDPRTKQQKAHDHYQKTREKVLEDQHIFRQAHLEEFRQREKLWRDNNRAQLRERERRYRAAHREQRNASVRASRKKYPDRVRLLNAKRRALQKNAPVNDFTRQQWGTMQAHYGYRCVYCGRKPKKLTMDHITPLAKGGGHTLTNIVPACAPCNFRKHTRDVPTPIQPLLL